MKHLYLAVTCKTPWCSTDCLVKYLGPYAGQSELGQSVPAWFDFRCGDCHRAHRYLYDEIYPIRTDTAPPPGLRNPF